MKLSEVVGSSLLLTLIALAVVDLPEEIEREFGMLEVCFKDSETWKEIGSEWTIAWGTMKGKFMNFWVPS